MSARGVARDIVVVGGSAGSIESVLALASLLPADFPGAVFLVVHADPGGLLAELLPRRSVLPVSQAVDGQLVASRRIYLAAPGAHLLLEGGRVRLTRGPRENGLRPSVDALFRSAARSYGPRVAGVVLSGPLDAGAAGLRAIRAAGGIALAQDPAEAAYPEMPLAALVSAGVDRVAPVEKLAEELVELAAGRGAARPARRPPRPDEREGTLADIACPACHGPLRETDGRPSRSYRCHVGHLYSVAGLSDQQARDLEISLWTALRALDESRAVSLRLAGCEDAELAKRHRTRAEALARFSGQLLRFLLSPRLGLPPAPLEPALPLVRTPRRPPPSRAQRPRGRRAAR